MNLLLDTNALLWWLFDLPSLGQRSRRMIGSHNTAVFVSPISAAEIAIKEGVGKLQAPKDLDDEIAKNAFIPLPLSMAHTLAVRDLPRHHGDLFDRLLVAQAQCENLSLITGDKKLSAYDVSVIDARS